MKSMTTEWAPVKRQTAAGPWPAEKYLLTTVLSTPSAAAAVQTALAARNDVCRTVSILSLMHLVRVGIAIGYNHV